MSLYQDKLKGLAQRQHADRQVAVYAELFQWPLGVAIALLSLAWLLGVSVRRRVSVAAPATATLIAALLFGVAMMAAPRAWASPLTAQDEYQKGQYAQAQREYAQSLKSDPNQSHLQFNLGAAAYKAGDFAAATAAFNNALEDPGDSAAAKCLLQPRQCLVPPRGEGCRDRSAGHDKTWQQSLGAYDTALQLKPADADAKFNRNVVQNAAGRIAPAAAATATAESERQGRQEQTAGSEGPEGPERTAEPSSRTNEVNRASRTNNRISSRISRASKISRTSNRNAASRSRGQPNLQPDRRPSSSEAAAAAQDIGKPDQLSRLEAEQLLDSVKGEERHLAAAVRNGKPENRAAPLRDW